jgi:hypothetical protein
MRRRSLFHTRVNSKRHPVPCRVAGLQEGAAGARRSLLCFAKQRWPDQGPASQRVFSRACVCSMLGAGDAVASPCSPPCPSWRLGALIGAALQLASSSAPAAECQLAAGVDGWDGVGAPSEVAGAVQPLIMYGAFAALLCCRAGCMAAESKRLLGCTGCLVCCCYELLASALRSASPQPVLKTNWLHEPEIRRQSYCACCCGVLCGMLPRPVHRSSHALNTAGMAVPLRLGWAPQGG